MGIISYTTKERDLLARLMRAEAVGEGDLGMLMVGNVVLNRALASCLTFKNIRTLSEAIYQNPGGFSGVDSSLFYSNPTTKETELADRILKGEYYYPATHALWFYAPASGEDCKATWWDQKNSGRYKNHCFYEPESGVCVEIH
jgi:N-acetylmuramoyl-L-alanine amidase